MTRGIVLFASMLGGSLACDTKLDENDLEDLSDEDLEELEGIIFDELVAESDPDERPPGPVCADGENLAYMAPTFATSTYCAGAGLHCYSASRINDGSTNTTVGGFQSWTNADVNPPGWGTFVGMNFPGSTTFNRVRIYTSDGYPIRDYQIEYNNGSGWSPIVTVYGNTYTQRTHNFASTAGFGVRVIGMSGPNNQPQYVRVNELQVFNATDCYEL